MKKTAISILIFVISFAFFSCTDDDHSLAEIIALSDNNFSNDTIYVEYNGSVVTVKGDDYNLITTDGADVTANIIDTTAFYVFVLSGTSTDGQFKTYAFHKFGIVLNNLTLSNNDGPALNNQCHKSLYLTCPAGTTNTLSDGTSYTETTEDQKGALFSEGQILFSGAGSLNITGNCKNAIACDDYIAIDSAIAITATSISSNGIKVNDGIHINGGTLSIIVSADGAKGIKCDSIVNITGGDINITTSGDYLIETTDGVTDTSTCAGIKCSGTMTMSAGTLTITSTGDGGKGINCDSDIYFTGGTLNVTCTGDETVSKPKGVKSDAIICISGGSFTSQSSNARATDCANADHYPTILGEPTIKSLAKKKVIVSYE